MLTKKELKALDSASLKNEVASLRQELFTLKLSKNTGQVKNYSQFRALRVQVARALTLLKQKEAR
ncbi:MAG: 50S ribosomal protein L29 [Epsilonproteobacteria bacterium]|nr:50S ribosomal protein L29 [Campylobacterota bacterium]